MSTRQAILQVFLDRVGAIQKANGYATDAGLKIFFGSAAELGDDDPDSAIAILVQDDQTSGGALGEDEQTFLPVDLAALAKASGDLAWVEIELVIGDIKRAIETADRSFNGLLARTLFRGRTKVLKRAPGSTTIGAAITYTANYLDQWGG